MGGQSWCPPQAPDRSGPSVQFLTGFCMVGHPARRCTPGANPVVYRIRFLRYRFSSGKRALAGKGLRKPIKGVESQKTPGKQGFSRIPKGFCRSGGCGFEPRRPRLEERLPNACRSVSYEKARHSRCVAFFVAVGARTESLLGLRAARTSILSRFCPPSWSWSSTRANQAGRLGLAGPRVALGSSRRP